MVNLVEALGLGITPPRGGGAPVSAFAPVGTVAQRIQGGNIVSAPGAPSTARPQSTGESPASQALATETLIAGDIPGQEPGALGLNPTTKDSIILGLTAGLESGGPVGGAIGALRGYTRGKTIERGRPAREEAKAHTRAQEAATMKLEQAKVAIQEFDAKTKRGVLGVRGEELVQKTASDRARLELDVSKAETEALKAGVDIAALPSEIALREAQAESEQLLGVRAKNAAEAMSDDPAEQKRIAEKLIADQKKGSLVTIEGKKETAFSEEAGKLRAKREDVEITQVRENARTAEQSLGNLHVLKAASPLVDTGAFGTARLSLAQAAEFLGMDELSGELIGNVGSAEMINSSNVQLTTQLLQRLSGATSDFEFKTLQTAAPSLMTTPEGNALLADININAAENARALETLMDEYTNIHGTLRPKGEKSWFDTRREFFENNPVLTPDIRARMAGLRNAGFNSPEQAARLGATAGAIDSGALSNAVAITNPLQAEDIQMLSFNDLNAISNNEGYWNTLSDEVQDSILFTMEKWNRGAK